MIQNIIKNPFMLSILGGILISLYSYIDNKFFTKHDKNVYDYTRIFVISSIVIGILLPYYHIPKRIFKEVISTGPAPF